MSHLDGLIFSLIIGQQDKCDGPDKKETANTNAVKSGGY